MLQNSNWTLKETEFNCNRMRYYESVFSLGNGYIGTRGAFEEDYRLRYPGTYVAGLFDEAPSQVTELPNLADWLSLEIYIAGERFDLTTGEILAYERSLNLKSGVLTREVCWKSDTGKITNLKFRRFVSLSNKHTMGIELTIEPVNHSSECSIVSGLNGQVTNDGTQHFVALEQSVFGQNGIYILHETAQSKHSVWQGATHFCDGDMERDGFRNGPRKIEYFVIAKLQQGVATKFHKLAYVHTSRDHRFSELKGHHIKEQCIAELTDQGSKDFDQQLRLHELEWEKRWSEADVEICGNSFDQLAIRFAIFHLIQMSPWLDPRSSIAAKGLSGPGYRGHVFWDTEIFMLPFFVYTFPKVARSLLTYRHLTLPGALKKAQENGYKGAMYPWESADTGEETTPRMGGIDHKTRKPIPILCGDLEQHISADIAYALMQYLSVTHDWTFMEQGGAEILFLTARFWASRVSTSQDGSSYEINNVIGPDEYKEHVNNNFYTNSLVKWHFLQAWELFKRMDPSPALTAIQEKIGLSSTEAERWPEIAERLHLSKADQIWEQFDGFFSLTEIDVLKYRHKPSALHQEYSWEQVQNSQVLKQADVIMLMYLLSEEFSEQEKKANYAFYEPRTNHESSLSAAIHSAFASQIGLDSAAYAYFSKAARIDLGNELGNSDHGLHAASLGGLWQAVIHGFGGIRVVNGTLTIQPSLPAEWTDLMTTIRVAGVALKISISKECVAVSAHELMKDVPILIEGHSYTLAPGRTRISHKKTGA